MYKLYMEFSDVADFFVFSNFVSSVIQCGSYWNSAKVVLETTLLSISLASKLIDFKIKEWTLIYVFYLVYNHPGND
jgi:hypothetical protein